MNCKKCGSPLAENDQFCKNCGATVNAQEEQSVSQQPMNPKPEQVQQPMNNQAYQQPNYSNNGQPAWQNGYNPTPNFQQQKPNSNVKYIVIGVVVVVAIFAGMFIFNSLGNNGGTSYSGGSGSSSVTKTSNKSYKVNFKGFTFTIPDNLVYEEDDGVLLIGDEDGTWVTQLELEQGSFSQLKANKNQLQAMMQQNGYTCTAAVEKTLGGIDFITMEISASGQKAIAALAKANAMYFIGVTAMNQDNDYDYKLLETIAPIIESAESTSSATNNLSTNTKLDMSGFAELAK